MSYIGNQPSGQGQAERFIFTCTGTTPTITHDDDGLPIGYTVNHVSVYLNGVKQVVGTDVTATNGSTIVFAANLAVSDVVEVIALSTFAAATTEGTSIQSTGETGGTKFLREDGDNSSSWQTAGSSDASTLTTGTLGNTVQDNITRLGTVTAGLWRGTAISQVAHMPIIWAGDNNITTIELWNETTSLLNMTMIQANAKILFSAVGSEGKLDYNGDSFKLFMCAKVGSDSLTAVPTGHMVSDYQAIYCRTDNQLHYASITGGMTLTNSIGDVVCFSPACERISGSYHYAVNYLGAAGRGHFTIAEIH